MKRNICLNIALNEVASVGIRPTCARTAMCNGRTRGATASVPWCHAIPYTGNFDWTVNVPPPRHR
jgi:hypothetical protein